MTETVVSWDDEQRCGAPTRRATLRGPAHQAEAGGLNAGLIEPR
jgi:hypothetical protein